MTEDIEAAMIKAGSLYRMLAEDQPPAVTAVIYKQIAALFGRLDALPALTEHLSEWERVSVVDGLITVMWDVRLAR